MVLDSAFISRKWQLYGPVIFALSFRFFGGISYFLLALVLARNLGAEGSSLIFMGLSITFVLSALVRFGYENIVIKDVANFFTESYRLTLIKLLNQVLFRVGALSFPFRLPFLCFSDFVAISLFIERNSPPF